MSFSRNQKERPPDVETNVWACTNDDCPGWMRETFSFAAEPSCPLCEANMVKEVRLLPEIE